MTATIISLTGAILAVLLLLSVPRFVRAFAIARVDLAILTFSSSALVIYETGLLGRGSTSQLAILSCSVAACLFVFISSRTRIRASLTPIFFFPAGISFYLAIVNAASNPGISPLDSMSRFAPAFFWLAMAVFLSTASVTREMVFASAAMTLAIVAIVTPIAGDPSRPCDQFKCGIFGYIYTGPFISENFLAKVAALAGIALLARVGGPLAKLTGALAALLLVGATSRTALLAIAAAMVGGFVISRCQARLRVAIAQAVIVTVFAVSWTISTTAAPSDFSNRGFIWAQTRAAIGDSYLFGLGIDRWGQLQAIGMLPMNFPHNQLLLMTFAGGLVAASLFVVMLLALARRISATDAPSAGLGLLIYLVVSGLTEVMWNPATIDGHSVVVLFVLAFAAMEPRSSSSKTVTSLTTARSSLHARDAHR